jgi:hypothetical protein
MDVRVHVPLSCSEVRLVEPPTDEGVVRADDAEEQAEETVKASRRNATNEDGLNTMRLKSKKLATGKT